MNTKGLGGGGADRYMRYFCSALPLSWRPFPRLLAVPTVTQQHS